MPTQLKRPRVKPEHRPIQVAGNRIRIGGTVYGIAGEVDDPTGSVWTLLNAMDGSRSVEAIVAAVVEAHPGERPPAVRAAVELFVESGHVYDAAVSRVAD